MRLFWRLRSSLLLAALGLLAVAALLLGACGDDDDDATATEDTTTTIGAMTTTTEMTEATTTTSVGGSNEPPTTIGDCYDKVGDGERKVDCASPHDGEVILVDEDSEAGGRTGAPVCPAALTEYIGGDPPSGLVTVEKSNFDPTGQTSTVCFVEAQDGSKLNGSVRD